jgi:hypothetical protein
MIFLSINLKILIIMKLYKKYKKEIIFNWD